MTRSPQDLFDHVAELTELYLRDEIAADQLAELETLVRENEEAAAAMRTVLKQAGTMRVVFAEQRQFASRIGEANRDEYLALLQTLSPTEEVEPVHLVGSLDPKRPLWQQWQFVIPSGIAALLAIAVILIVAIPTNGRANRALDIAQVPDKPAESAPPIPRDHPGTAPANAPVATLTATHNAQWDQPSAERALARGSQLHAGQTLTLTAGSAEITTHRGAIAILEAPCTVELTDNNNALRLHTGKLVGICETESSKGFLVRTPHMDVTDLGTKFGVDVSKPDVTQTHVLEGSVRVAHPGDGLRRSETLIAGQAIEARSGSTELARIEMQPSRFVLLSPETGQALPAGASLAGITALSGKAVWSDQHVQDLNMKQLPKRDEIFIHKELTGLVLDSDIDVVLYETGTHNDFSNLTTKPVPSGTAIRSYIVCLKPTEQSTPCQATMTFEGEVLGIVVTRGPWRTFRDAVQRLPGSPTTFMSGENTGGSFEGGNGANADTLTLSPDRRTLSVTLTNNEYFRVIVREPTGGTQP